MHLCLEIHAMRAVASLMLLLCCLAGAQVPMGPGSMAPYSGGGGRQRGFGYVREPAKGFFIAGSTLRDMNGVYAKVDNVRLRAHMRTPARPHVDRCTHLTGLSVRFIFSCVGVFCVCFHIVEAGCFSCPGCVLRVFSHRRGRVFQLACQCVHLTPAPCRCPRDLLTSFSWRTENGRLASRTTWTDG